MDRRRFAWYVLLFCTFLFTYINMPRTLAVASGVDTPSTRSKDIDLLLSMQLANAQLVIPRIGVKAAIDPVETDLDGAMAVPTHQPWTHTGWYINGAYPGEQGSAVIDGHLDRPGGSPAVFWNLHLLRPGDQVLFDTPGQPLLHFKVIKSAMYRPAEAPLQEIFNKTNGRFLNLVTCIGRWIPSIHQTTHRLVIYTELT